VLGFLEGDLSLSLIVVGTDYFSPLTSERAAVHYSHHEGRQAVALRFSFPRNGPDRRLVVVLDATAEGVRHQVFRERTDQWNRPFDQRLGELRRGRHVGAVVHDTL